MTVNILVQSLCAIREDQTMTPVCSPIARPLNDYPLFRVTFELFNSLYPRFVKGNFLPPPRRIRSTFVQPLQGRRVGAREPRICINYQVPLLQESIH